MGMATQIACPKTRERHRIWNIADVPKALVAFPPADGVSWQYWIPPNKNWGRAHDLAQLRDRQLRCNGLKHSVLNRWPDVPAGLKGSLASTEHPGEVSPQGVGRSSCTIPCQWQQQLESQHILYSVREILSFK